MIVTLYEGDDDERDGTEMSLSSEATLNWSSDGSKFTVTIPETAVYDDDVNYQRWSGGYRNLWK